MNKYNILENTWYLNDLNKSIIVYLKKKNKKNKIIKTKKNVILNLIEFIMPSQTSVTRSVRFIFKY
jgi:hypothetical protein